MFTKSKTALAVALVLGSTSLALAQGGYDPNGANRYPAYAEPGTYGYVAGANTPRRMDQAPHKTFQSAPVQLRQSRDVGLTNDRGNYTGRESEFDVDRNDHASSPYAGGGF